MISSGDLLGGRYRLGSLLASGGMGQVWRAHDTRLQRTVAVKLLRSEFTGDPDFLQRFRAEAQHAALLNDAHIAAVHDYGETDGTTGPVPYLVMELVHGSPLSDVLAREGRLDVARTLRIVRQTASALAAAHAAGVVHRDVKPGNVLVTPDGDVKITDFGIAWSASSTRMTRTGQVLGTAQYLSPEQVNGAPATPASDVYALGVVAHQCLSGRLPFDAETPMQVALMQVRDQPPPLPPDVPAGVRELVARMLAKDPAQRLPDGAAVRDAVDALTPGASVAGTERHPTAVLAAPLPAHPAASPVTTASPSTASPGTAVLAGVGPAGPDHPHRRRSWLVLAAAVVAVLAVLGVAVVLGSSGGDAPPAAATPTTSPTTTTPAPPATVPVTAALVGRPVAEAEAELAARGLLVQRRAITTADVPDGQVISVDPVGEVLIGRTVTLTHAVAPPPAPATTPAPAPAPPPAEQEDEGDEDEGGGNGDEGGGNGDEGNRGNGNGNGRGGRGDG